MAKPSGDYRVCIYRQLCDNNSIYSKPYKILISTNDTLTKENKQLKLKKIALELEVQQTTQENTDLLGKLKSQAKPDEKEQETGITKLAYSNLESKVFSLQEELSQSYKKSNEKAEELLKCERSIKLLKHEIEELKQNKKLLLEKCKEADEDISRLTQQLNEKNALLKVQEHEMQLLKENAQEKEKRAAQLEVENQELLERWLKRVSEEAEKMNEATLFYNSMLEDTRRQKLVEKAEMEANKALHLTGGSSIFEDNSKLTLLASVIPEKIKRNFEAHKGECNAIAFSHAGNILATGSNDKSVKLWDTRSGNHKATLMGSVQSIMDVDFLANDELVLGASNDNSTRIWHVQQGRVRHTLTGHTGKVLGAVFGGDTQQVKVVTGSHDRTVKIWDLVKGYCIKTIFCLSGCNDVCISNDDTLVGSGHMDSQIRLWDTRSGDVITEISGVHSKPITCVQVRPDGRALLSCSRDNRLKLFDLRSYDVLATYKHDNYRSAVNWTRAAFSPDGYYVVSGSATGEVVVWNTQTSTVEKVFPKANTCAVTAVGWHPHGNQIASCDRGGNLCLWQ